MCGITPGALRSASARRGALARALDDERSLAVSSAEATPTTNRPLRKLATLPSAEPDSVRAARVRARSTPHSSAAGDGLSAVSVTRFRLGATVAGGSAGRMTQESFARLHAYGVISELINLIDLTNLHQPDQPDHPTNPTNLTNLSP